MKKINICVLALSLSTASIIAMPERGRVSKAYHKVSDKLTNHKFKVGFAVGAVGSVLVKKAFGEEIEVYVKPLFKRICRKVGNFFRRVFRREEKL